MKKLLFGLGALIAAPVSGQQVPAPAQTAPRPAQATPVTAQTAPATTAVTAQQPASSGAEVATIVAKEFPAYDKDASGALSQVEFGEWMVRLKTIADPATRPDAPSTKTWVNAAFAQADADRSRSLTLGELTGFLSQGRS